MRMLFDRQGRKQKFPALVSWPGVTSPIKVIRPDGHTCIIGHWARANYHAFPSKFANVPCVFDRVAALKAIFEYMK